MLVNILTITIGVVLGTLVTTCLSLCVVFNKTVLTKFVNYYTKLVMEISKDLMDEFELLEKEEKDV